MYQIVGQTGLEEREAEKLFSAHNADDRILQTCLLLRSRGLATALYTNDKNLANKALVSKVDAFSSAGLRAGLERALAQLPQFAGGAEGDGEDNEDHKGGEQTSAKKKINPGEIFTSFYKILGAPKQAQQNGGDSNGHDPMSDVDMQNIDSLFTTTWHYIHTYTWHFCRVLDVRMEPGLDQPPPLPFSNMIVTAEDARAFLRPLLVSVIKLYEKLYDVVRCKPTELSVNTEALKEFFKHLISFLPNLRVYLFILSNFYRFLKCF